MNSFTIVARYQEEWSDGKSLSLVINPFDEVTTLKGGMVVAVDVPFGTGQLQEQALLIENDTLYRIYADGRKETISSDIVLAR